MGFGKTQGAITMMNENVNERYVFITPYLDEVERIKKSCAARRFVSPEHKGAGKLNNLHDLLGKGQNIASTHALFSTYTPYTAELIHNGEYTLILDEVFCVAEPLKIKPVDFDILLTSGKIALDGDGEHVVWLDDEYDGTKFQDIMQKAKSGTLILYQDMLLFWTFPIDIFRAFKEVIILTYMFDSQIQRYYFDVNGVETEYIGTRMVDGLYRFCPVDEMEPKIRNLRNLIEVVEDQKMNRIGDFDFSLSSSWYERESKKKSKPLFATMKNNLYNFFRNKCNAKSSDVLWTTFKEHRSALSGKGYTLGFLSCNVRATNEYRNRNALAYCVNIFFHPILKRYFTEHGCNVQEDEYALSEMIQWIWRSAIRDGKPITAYVPSKRMRRLLCDWIELVNTNDSVEEGGESI